MGSGDTPGLQQCSLLSGTLEFDQAHSFNLSLSHFLEILRFKEDNGCETISMLPNWLPRRC